MCTDLHIADFKKIEGSDKFVVPPYSILTRLLGRKCCGQTMHVAIQQWDEKCSVCSLSRTWTDYHEFLSCNACKHVIDTTNYSPRV